MAQEHVRSARRVTGRRSARRLLVAAAALTTAALALCGCARGPEPGVPPIPLSSSAPVAAPAPPGPPGGPRFTPCRGGLECASVPVPVDYANPAGPTLPVAIARRPATNPAARVGVLLVNPGGPGGSGIELVQAGVLPPEITDRFDVIGFDPRGVGDSAGLQCPLGPDTPYRGDPDPGDPADEAATNDAVDRYDLACGQRYPDLLPHLGTRNVARDMDRIREALGEERIDYLGFSYGTSIGQAYAQLYPTRLRSIVLDGVVDVSKPGLDSAQAESFENTLRQFDAACRVDPVCPVRADPIGTLDRVRARVTANPLPVAGTSPLSAGLLEIGVVYPLYSTSSWPQLAQALAAADAGDGAPMRALATAYFRSSNSDTYNAVTCLDNAWPTEDEQVFAAARATEARAPHFSGNVLVSGLTCADWPAPQQPLTPIEGYTGPPMLILGTTNDPATPYQNSVALRDRLPGSVLLTYRGDGHTVYTNGVPCIDDAVNRYLLEGTLPPPDTTC
ncbi:alpha/beta hydrolase [Actinomycetospora straminea]|nr:alpha/beta hydrolase [Actinomycetospora straminea]MDD7932584.1 alpha/beta hydrolase [Actinomycetospora straminea]